MVTRAFVADMVTGDQIQTLPTSLISWEKRIITPEALRVSMTLRPRAHQRLDVRNATMELKSSLVVMDGARVLGAGPIWERNYDDATGLWQAEAAGIRTLLDKRFVLPQVVTADDLLIAAGDDAGQPNPAMRTTFTAATWPQIVRGLLEQSMLREGGALPLLFGETGSGAHDKLWEAASFKSVGEALDDITKLVDGVEIDFLPQVIANKLRYLVRVGEDAKPQLSSPTVHKFDFTPTKSSVRRLRVRSSGRELASERWGSGGRQAARALFSRVFSRKLIDAGYPRTEGLSSAHSTVIEQDTLDRYTAEDLLASAAPLEWWSFQFHADRAPFLADVNVGDYCTLHLRNNRYLADSPAEGYLRRIVALSGDNKSRWVTATTDAVNAW